jgi:ribosomal-protein-alanine N-acetyltransferase
VVEENDVEVVASLACPPDPPRVAWLRLFVGYGIDSDEEYWHMLWEPARRELADQPGITIAAIALEKWLPPILESSGFTSSQQIVMLECREHIELDDGHNGAIIIRPMLSYDIQDVVDVDIAAFDLLWQNSLASTMRGYQQAALAAVAELNGKVVGYQISTRTSLGVHLARLAVQPEVQRRGVGQALVADLIRQAERRGIRHFTVNTQSDNAVSLALYKKIGFQETGERYPVYQRPVSG